MDYYKELNRTLNLDLLQPIIQSGLRNAVEFEKLFSLISIDNSKVAWRAAWVCEKISNINPDFYKLGHLELIIKIAISTDNNGLLRTCLSILNNLSEPKRIDVNLLNACYSWLSSQNTPIAVKSLSLKLLCRFSLIEPDLKLELIAYLEHMDSMSLSQGVQATKRNVLKNLNYK